MFFNAYNVPVNTKTIPNMIQRSEYDDQSGSYENDM